MKNYIRNLMGSTLVALSIAGCANPTQHYQNSKFEILEISGKTQKCLGSEKTIEQYVAKHPSLVLYRAFDEKGIKQRTYAEGEINGYPVELSDCVGFFDDNSRNGPSRILELPGWTDQKIEALEAQ